MSQPAARSTPRGGSRPARAVTKAAVAVGLAALLAAACAQDDDALQATPAGFVIEPADEIGPDAFTPPVDTGADGACDPEALIAELAQRPAARSAWAGVLGVPEPDVDAYIRGLVPQVLAEDTAVTNHGLHDGTTAYARPSVLTAGTAVLVDTDVASPALMTQLSPDELTTTSTTTTSTSTTQPVGTTTIPDDTPGQPVARCRCGNPLLPPYWPSNPTTTTSTTSPGSTTSTTRPTSSTSTTRPSSSTSSSSSTPSSTSTSSSTSSSTTSTSSSTSSSTSTSSTLPPGPGLLRVGGR